jgi:DNA-binding winged helix-turn-helix (wHTH) protein
MRARFGEFAVDFETRQLLRDTHPVHLTPKAYQLLALLVEARPRALSKEELQQGLWPNTFVDEANLSVVVAELRAALGDAARNSRYVRTVHGFGYAFEAEVTREASRTPGPASAGNWWLHSDSVHVKLHDGENLVGRDLPIDVWLDSGGVSRRHAKVVVEGSVIWVEDLGSKNGTWVNGERIAGRTDVADGTELRFGPVLMWLRWTIPAGSTETIGPLV